MGWRIDDDFEEPSLERQFHFARLWWRSLKMPKQDLQMFWVMATLNRENREQAIEPGS